MGEGFGVPIIESQACGVPVIVSPHSAMTELVGPGWLVEGDRWYDPLQNSMAFMPHIASIEAAFEKAYADRDNQERRDAAREFAQQYDADHVVATYWAPIIEHLAAQGEPREVPPLNGNRAQRRRAAKAKA
jgi:glycosyltransferase involved in cell wall biosynthesis